MSDFPGDATKAEQCDYKSIALLSAAHLSDDVNQGVVPAMLPFLIAAYHFSYAAAAGLVLAQTLSASVVQPFFGWLADRRPSPWLIPVGLSFAGVGVAASGFASNYKLIFLAIAISGLGISAFHPEAARRVRYLSGTRQATAMSLFSVGGMVGIAVGPLLITPTLLALGTHGAAVMALPVLIMALAVIHRLPHLAAAGAYATVDGSRAVSLSVPARWDDFARLTVVSILRSTVFYGINTFVPLYWAAVLRGSRAGGGFALTTMLASVAVGTLIGGRLADRYGRRIIVIMSLGLAVPLLLVFLSSGQLTIAGLALVPLGVALGSSTSVVVVMGQEYLPNRVGLAAGVTLGLAFTIGGVLMPVFGSIADHYGLATAMFVLCSVPALGFIVSLTLHESSAMPLKAEIGEPSESPSAQAQTPREILRTSDLP